MFFNQPNRSFADITSIYLEAVGAKSFEDWEETVSYTAAEVEKSMIPTIFVFHCFFQFEEFFLDIMPILIKVGFVIFIENVPVESLIILQLKHLLRRLRSLINSHDLLSGLSHLVVPFVISHILRCFIALITAFLFFYLINLLINLLHLKNIS